MRGICSFPEVRAILRITCYLSSGPLGACVSRGGMRSAGHSSQGRVMVSVGRELPIPLGLRGPASWRRLRSTSSTSPRPASSRMTWSSAPTRWRRSRPPTSCSTSEGVSSRHSRTRSADAQGHHDRSLGGHADGRAAGRQRRRSRADPHVWLDPLLYGEMVETVRAALAGARPGDASTSGRTRTRSRGRSRSWPTSTRRASRTASGASSSRTTPRSAIWRRSTG